MKVLLTTFRSAPSSCCIILCIHSLCIGGEIMRRNMKHFISDNLSEELRSMNKRPTRLWP
jgi:hypothetical protein